MNFDLSSIDMDITTISINSALDIYDIMRQIFKREEKLDPGREHFWVIALNNINKILNIELIAIGSATKAIVRPMEILRVPLSKGALGIMLVHNHPSGHLEPSEADKEVTDRMIQACRLMQTPVLDHVIITEHSYYSFKSSGLLLALENSIKYMLPYELEERSLKAGREEREQEIAKQMLSEGIAMDLIRKVTGLSKKVIEKLK